MRINDEALAYVAENLQGDRQLARRELDKLIAYAGEAEMITGDDARACIGDSTEQSVDDALMAVASGRIDEADRVIEKLWAEGANSVAVLRSAQRHFGRLHQARIDMPILSNADPNGCDGYSNAKATKRIVEPQIRRSDRMAKSRTAV